MKERATYTSEQKMSIVLRVLSHKNSIQEVAAETGVAPTLISLWKKQAELAIAERFLPQPRGRRKAVKTQQDMSSEMKVLKSAARKARHKVSRLELALAASKKHISTLERKLADIAEQLGFRLVRERKTRTETDKK